MIIGVPAVKISPEKPQPVIPVEGSFAPGGYGRGVLFCIVSTLLFGCMFPVMTGVLKHIDPFTFTSIRYLAAGAAFLLTLRLKEGAGAFSLNGRSPVLLWILGSVGFCGFGSFVFLGQQLAGREGALTASIMMATQPMMGLLLNSALQRKAPPLPVFLFILMSFSGILLVVTRGDIAALVSEPQNYAANGLIVIGAACWVVYSFAAPRFSGWSALKYTTVTIWFGLPTIIALNLVLLAMGAEQLPSLADLSVIVPDLLFMGPVAGFLAVLLWNSGNKILTPMNGMLFIDIVPLTTFAVSALTGVIPAPWQIVGAGLTAMALIFNNLYLRRRATARS